MRAGLARGLAAQPGCEIALSAASFAELAEAGFGAAAVVVVDVAQAGEGELDVVAGAGPTSCCSRRTTTSASASG